MYLYLYKFIFTILFVIYIRIILFSKCETFDNNLKMFSNSYFTFYQMTVIMYYLSFMLWFQTYYTYKPNYLITFLEIIILLTTYVPNHSDKIYIFIID